MWSWNLGGKKALRDSIARTQMEIALSGPNPYEERLEKMKIEQLERDMQHSLMRSQQKLLADMVPRLEELGSLAEGEYAKWILDETGTYIPKLK